MGKQKVLRTQTRFWNKLPAETRWEIARRGAALMLSNFLHGEQGALMVASQLVNAVPHMDAKFYAATQTMDEARHVEVFAGKTLRSKLRACSSTRDAGQSSLQPLRRAARTR